MKVIHGQLAIDLQAVVAKLKLEVLAYRQQLTWESDHVKLLIDQLSQRETRLSQLEDLLGPLPEEVGF